MTEATARAVIAAWPDTPASEAFRARLARFLEIPRWWARGGGGYEMFCCDEALKIVTVLGRDREAIKRFHKAASDEQRAMVPDLALDEHSGNTFGTACVLADAYAVDPASVVKVHAAMCAIAGCTDAGCWASTKEAAQSRRARKAGDS